MSYFAFADVENERALKHLKSVYEKLESFRNNIAVTRSSISTCHGLCESQPLALFTRELDNCDQHVRNGMDELAAVLGKLCLKLGTMPASTAIAKAQEVVESPLAKLIAPGVAVKPDKPSGSLEDILKGLAAGSKEPKNESNG